MGKFWRKSNPIFSRISFGRVGQPQWSPFNKKAAARLHNNVDILFSAINLLSTEASQARWKVVSTDSQGNVVERKDHRLTRLLNNPNPTQDQSAFIHAAVAYRSISGDSYINLHSGTVEGAVNTDDFTAIPSELWTFRPDRVQITPGKNAVAGYEYRTGNSADPLFFPSDAFGNSNIIHWKTFNPLDDYYGLSPIQAAMKGIDTYDKTVDWNAALLDNAGRPSGALIWKGEGSMSEEQASEFSKMIDENVKNKRNRGRPLMLPGNVEWKELSLSPKDMDFLKAKDDAAMSILRVLNLDPVLLNLGADPTFNNKRDAKLSLWDSAVIPLLLSLTSALNQHLVPRFKDESLSIVLDLSDVTALEPRREGLWKRANEAGDFLTVNEQRKLVNMEKTDGGDVIMVSSTKIPLTFATEPLPDPKPADGDGKKKA